MDDKSSPDLGHGVSTDRKDRRKVRSLYALVAILLVGTVAAVGWLYYSSARTVREQKTQISSLRAQLKEHGIEVVVDPEAGDGDADEAGACDGGSAYSADIGNFDLTLSDPNVIVRNLDANFEGGPITDLTIGRCLEGATNVVDAYPTYKVNILAHPAANAATLRANFEAEWGSPLTAGGPLTIDGVAAQIYTGSGLFDTKLVYFDHAGIGYQIELPDSNATSEAILTDVTSDWSFTP